MKKKRIQPREGRISENPAARDRTKHRGTNRTQIFNERKKEIPILCRRRLSHGREGSDKAIHTRKESRRIRGSTEILPYEKEQVFYKIKIRLKSIIQAKERYYQSIKLLHEELFQFNLQYSKFSRKHVAPLP